MFLKNYQNKVVTELKLFYSNARQTKDAFDIAKKNLPENMRNTLNWVQATFQSTKKEYKDQSINGLGEYYPRIVMKVPTGGGKTLLAVESIREYQNIFARKRTGLIVWIVPSETIYSQTVQKLRDKSNHLRQLLDQSSGNKTLILEKGQRITTNDIEEHLVILFVMIQSISRHNAKEALKVFQDSGGFESFFPADNRNDLHEELLKTFPNLDYISSQDSIFPLIKTSLGNAVRVSSPFIIIDEIHKVFTPMARKTIDNLNPEMILGLTATPKDEMNILVRITGSELKEEEMVKLDMHIIPPPGRKEDNWKLMIKEIKSHRDNLEKIAVKYKQSSGIYIRPIALIQVERTGKEQRGKGHIHSLDVKDYLQEIGINSDEIAIKTSSQNDIEDVNLFSQDCNIRYIITKEALREGWDCSYAYILGIIPNVNSDTGITQLVGRILRQPYAKKTGIQSLDESYVYYSKGDTRHMLEKVDTGFKNEGLEDLVSKIKVKDNDTINVTKTVRIKKELKTKYGKSFYLPVWVMIEENKKKRRFSYALDIKPKIDLYKFNLTNDLLERIKSSLSEETQERQSIIVSIDERNKFISKTETIRKNNKEEINIDYLTRRYAEIVDNPFLSRKIAINHVNTLIKHIGKEKLELHFSYIAAFMFNELSAEKSSQEKKIFLDYLNNNKIVLAVSDSPDIGHTIPKEDVITVGRIPNPYKYYLFEDADLLEMNSLERKVGDILDKQEKILWWFRNKASRNWYSIQGWKEYKIRPDFVAARKNDQSELDFVYVIESKGEHLTGNPNTMYKKSVLDTMTKQRTLNKIELHQIELPFPNTLNNQIECYLIEEGKEDETLRKLYK